MREETEQENWNKVDQLKEKNKEDLALKVDEGMKQKGEFTLITNEHNEQKAGREALQNEIKTMNDEHQKLVKQTEAHKQTIASHKMELSER